MGITEESGEYALAEMEQFGLPNRIHFDISEKEARSLAEKLGADKDIVLAGVALMDLKLGQAFKEGRLAEHVQMSVDAAKEFLEKFEISAEKKGKIINCIEAHHGTVPFKCKEAEICANADCYRFVHPKGFFVYLTVLGKRNPDFLACMKKAEEKMDEKYGILSLDACKQELEPYYIALKKLIEDSK